MMLMNEAINLSELATCSIHMAPDTYIMTMSAISFLMCVCLLIGFGIGMFVGWYRAKHPITRKEQMELSMAVLNAQEKNK